MADNEEEENSIISFVVLALVVSLIFIVVSVLLFPLFVSMFPGSVFLLPDSDDPQFDCKPKQEYDDLYNKYVNETWIDSDKIEGYKDIPEERRNNLSEDAKQYLRDSARVDYTPKQYQNLSKEEEEVFIKAIEKDGSVDVKTFPDKDVFLPEYVNLWENDVRYNNTTYECREIREEGV